MGEEKKNIFVDARSLNRPYKRGIAQVVSSIVAESESSFHWHLVADRPDLPFHEPPSGRFTVDFVKEWSYRLSTWEQWQFPDFGRRIGGDLLFFPANTCSLYTPIPTASIIHDTVEWMPEFNEGHEHSFYRSTLLPKAIKRASLVFTVSENSKSDIFKMFHGRVDPIVIYNGVNKAFFAETGNLGRDSFSASPEHSKSKKPYLLYLGGDIPRKRLSWAIDCWKPFHKRCDLVVCGVASQESVDMTELSSQEKSCLRLQPFLDDDSMVKLYFGSRGLLYPTLYEGFGLPVVEAHAAGVPVVHGKVGSLIELQGPLSLCPGIDDQGAWCDSIETILSNSIGVEAVEAGRSWAKKFTWERCSQRYLEEFEKFLFSRAIKSSSRR